jgi:hypothetical protein
MGKFGENAGLLFPKVTHASYDVHSEMFQTEYSVVWCECNSDMLILFPHSVTETCFKIYIFSGNLILNIIQWRMEYFAYFSRRLRIVLFYLL